MTNNLVVKELQMICLEKGIRKEQSSDTQARLLDMSRFSVGRVNDSLTFSS